MTIKSTILDITPTTIFQSSGTNVVTSLYFCNTNTGTLTFNLYLVPAAQIAGHTNIVYYTVQIAASDTYVIDTEKIMLDNGDTIQATTTIAGLIVATISSMGY